MSKIKRATSLLLTFVMVITVISVGLTFTASAAAPYVPRTPASVPSPNTFTVPDAIKTYGENENLSGNYIKAEGSIQFYLSGATEIALNTNNSGVAVGAPTVVGNVTVWNISGGSLSNTSATNVKFTVSYKVDGKLYYSSAWSAVYPMYHDAVVRTDQQFHGTSVSRDIKVKKVMWLAPTFGEFTGSGGTKIYYVPVYSGDGDNTFDAGADPSASGVLWQNNYGNKTGSQDKDMAGAITAPYPTGTYYADLSQYSTMAQLPVKLYTREYGGDYDGNHPMNLTATSIVSQKVNGSSVTTFGITGTGVGGGQELAQNTNYTTSFTGTLPAAGYEVLIQLKQHMKAQCKFIWTQSLETDDYINLRVLVYNKTALRNLVTSEKAANRQQSDYSTTGSVTWNNYQTALQTAYELLGRQNTTQAAIDAAVSALNAAKPVYVNDATSNGTWVSGMRYADASYEAADFQTNQIPSNFNSGTYPDGTKGRLYTWTTASALNRALEDIAYDRALNKRFQSVVDTMTVNLQTAISSLQYKSFNIVYNANGGTNAPATTSHKLYTSVEVPSAQPARQHYAFNGWYYDAACTAQASWPLAMSPANSYFAGDLNQKDDSIRTGITLYAGWVRTSVQITFDSNGGSSVEPIFGTPGTTTNAPPAPTKLGYNFAGWYYDVARTNPVSFPYTFTSNDVTFYAKWNIASFTVTFNSNGGTFNSTGSSTYQVTLSYGSLVSEPEIPVKYGKGFAGWYFDNNTFQNPVNFTNFTMPSSDITVYAKWSDTIYTITYDSNGGSSVPYVSYAAGDTVHEPAPPVRAGYTFAAWCSDAELTTPVSFPFIMTAGSKIFYAKWTPLKFNVYFDLGDDAYAPLEAQFPSSFDPADYYNLDCGSVLVAPEEPTMEGYVFMGWKLNGIDFTFPTTVPPQSITLVGSWEVEPPTVKYRLRTDKTGVLQQGDVVTITASIQSNYIVGSHSIIVYYDKRYFEPALKGATFTTPLANTSACGTNGNTYFTMIDNPVSAKPEGWNTWENGSCAGRVNNSSSPPLFQYYPESWRLDSNTLLPEYSHYDYVYFSVANAVTSPSGGYCVTADPEQDLCRFQLKVKDSAPVTDVDEYAQILMPYEFTRKSESSNEKIYAAYEDGNTYDTEFQASGITYVLLNGDIRFAVEEMAMSTISFNTKTEQFISPITEKVGRSITLPTPTKAYHNFLGWSLVDGGTTYVSNPYVVPADDVILYANWQPQSATYKVRHWKQNTTATGFLPNYEEETHTAVIGTTVTATPKTYAGFNTPNSVSDVVAPDGSLVLNLYYTRKTISITLNLAEGTISGSTVRSGLFEASVTPAVPDPTRTGFTFGGWKLNNQPYTFTTFPSSNIEVVASWIPNNYTFRFYLDGNLYETITKAYGENVTPPEVDVPVGQVFSGWLYNGTPYTFTSMPAANMDFYGTLSIDGYFVTLYIDGTQYGDPIPVYTGSQLTAEQLAYTAPTGFTFSGWKLSNSINGVPVTFPLNPTSNMSIYGFTTRAKYSITFWIVGEPDYYDRVLNIPYESSLIGIIPEIPEVDGFRFVCWYTDEDLTNEFTGTTMPAQNLNLYGAYVEIMGTIKFNLNGGQGTVPSDIVESVDTIVTEFPTDNGGTLFYMDDYVFVGWGLTPDATEPISSYHIQGEEPVTLYAIWGPAAVELVPKNGSTTVIDNTTRFITGLKEGISREELIDDYLAVNGNGTINAPEIIRTGTVIQLRNYKNEVVAEYTITIFGDVNGDGLITQSDMIMLKTIIAGTLEVEEGTALFKAVDFNKDGLITQTDYTQLKSVISGAYSIDQGDGRIS